MSKQGKTSKTQMNKAQRDNRANQLNPNNRAYWTSRGYTYEDCEEDE